MQKTIRNPITAEGIGIHFGQMTQMSLLPAEPDAGVVFRRVDLPGAPELKASWTNVGETFRCTCLSNDHVSVYTVEHLLAAVAGLGIDNLIVELNQNEVPIMDGSSQCFVFLLQAAGVVQQQDTIKYYLRVKEKIEVTEDEKYASLEPYNGFKIDFRGEFDNPAFNENNQYYAVDFQSASFVKEVSRARTFGFLSDVESLREKQMILGGSTKNAVVIGPEGVVNQCGLRYEDECVRHKVLDVVGDMALAGYAILGSFSGIKSGHALNFALLQKLLSNPDHYEMVALGQSS